MTVDELLDRMSSREITEWHAFFQLQEEEMERSSRRARAETEREGKQRPVIGDAGKADAIEEARKAQGLS